MIHNLLIVDDEVEILTWLKELFRYEFDMEIGVYTVDTGMEALRLLDQVRFDVVLTDIRMPEMNGIMLYKKIRENWPRCHTVLLTGFRDFDDMYQLFNNRDVQYLLKSEQDEVIMNTVRQAFSKVVQELELEEKRKKQLEQANEWLKKKFMDAVITGIWEYGKSEMIAGIAGLDIPFKPDLPVILLLVRIDAVSTEDSQKNSDTMTAGIQSILQTNFPPRLSGGIHICGGQIYLLVQPKEREDTDWDSIKAVITGAIEYSQEIFRNLYGETFSGVVKNDAVILEEIPKAAVRLRQVMVSCLGGEHEIILREEMAELGEDLETVSWKIDHIPVLKSYLELRKRNEYFEMLFTCFAQMTGKSSHDPHDLEIYYSISVMLLQFVNENHLNARMAFRIGIFKLTRADEHKDWEEAAQYLVNVSDAIFALLDDVENTLTDRALKRVQQYIDEHISEDLPLTTLACIGGFNASYLSHLFRQVCGLTVTDYICHKRMEVAKRLLVDTDAKVQDIAATSGYISANSFTRAFRTMKNYRQKNTGNCIAKANRK